MIPDGYALGMGRNPDEEYLKTHLYKSWHGVIEGPMCIYGWNRSDGERFSILRGNLSSAGVCEICLKRAQAGKPVFPSTFHKTKWL